MSGTKRWKWGCGTISLVLLSVMTLPDTLHYVRMEMTLPFSNQQQISGYIENQLPPDARIVVFPAELITGTFRAYLPDREFRRCSDGQVFRVFRTREPLPAKLDNALLEHLMGPDRQELYLLFQIGAFLHYRLPLDTDRYEFADFLMEMVFFTTPKAFFNAGEDYLLFRVTRKVAVR